MMNFNCFRSYDSRLVTNMVLIPFLEWLAGRGNRFQMIEKLD